MRFRDIKEIGSWALVTAFAALCIFAGKTAVCVDQPSAISDLLKATLSGCKLTATAQPTAEPNKACVRILAVNETSERQTLDFDLRLVRQQFSGDLYSRVPSVNDFKTSVESSTHIKRTLKPSEKANLTVLLTYKEKNETPEPTQPATLTLQVSEQPPLVARVNPMPASYTVEVSDGKSQQSIAEFRPNRAAGK